MMGDIRKLCREQYALRVAMRFDIPDELRRCLKTHERVPLFIDNLSKSLYRAPKDIKVETIIKAVHDMTDYFIDMIMKKADHQRLSMMEQHRLLNEQAKKAAAEAAADALFGGEEQVTRDAKGNETNRVLRVVE